MKPFFSLLLIVLFFSCNQNGVTQEDSFLKASAEFQKSRDFPAIGEQIYKARREKGITQFELAKETGLSSENIAAIENNRVVPTRDVIVSMQELLEFELVLD